MDIYVNGARRKLRKKTKKGYYFGYPWIMLNQGQMDILQQEGKLSLEFADITITLGDN